MTTNIRIRKLAAIKIQLIYLGVLLPFSTGIAFAADGSWFAGASVGSSNYSSVIDDAVTGAAPVGSSAKESRSDTATGFTALLGYRFNDYFALEGQYVSMGTASDDIAINGSSSGHLHAKIKLDGLGVDAVGFYPVGGVTSLFGKFGIIDSDLHEDITASDASSNSAVSQSASKTTYDWGAGIAFLLSPVWNLRVGYTQYHNVGNSNVTGSGNVNFLYVAATFSFY